MTVTLPKVCYGLSALTLLVLFLSLVFAGLQPKPELVPTVVLAAFFYALAAAV